MKLKFNVLTLLIILFVLAIPLIACSEQPTGGEIAPIEETASNEATVTTEATEIETADISVEGFPRTITDGQGRDLTFERPPERVLPYYNGSFGHLATLGIRPIATGANPEMLSDPIYLPDGESIPRPMVDGTLWDIDLEKVASYEPDLIMAFNLDEVNSSGAIAPVYLPSDAETLEDVFNELRNMASIFGVDEKAEEIISAFSKRVDAYAMLNEPNAEMTIMKLAILGDGQFSVATTGDPVCQMLDIVATCAWENPIGEEGWGYETSIEGILDLDPDIIILNSWVDDDADGARKAVQENPLYTELSAVKSGMVFSTPGYENPIASNLPAAQKVLDTYLPRFFPDTFPEPLTNEQVQEILAGETTNSGAEADFPRTVIDHAGRELTIDQPPQRIVTYYNDSYGMLATFGLKPVGQDVNPEMLIDPIYFDGAGQNIASISGEDGIDLEKVAALQPDMVMVYSEDEALALADIAPAFVTPDPTNLEELYQAVRLYGTLLGREVEAEAAIIDFQNRLTAYKMFASGNISILLAAPDEDNLGSVYIRTNNSPDCKLLNEIARCDWTNIVDDSWSYVATPETLLELNPDFIYYKSDWDKTLAELEVYVQGDPLWAELDAVQNGQLLHVLGYGNPIASSLPAATKLLDTFAPLLYPDSFDGPLTDAQVHEILMEQ